MQVPKLYEFKPISGLVLVLSLSVIYVRISSAKHMLQANIDNSMLGVSSITYSYTL